MKPSVVYLIDSLQTGGAERSLLETVKYFKRYNPVFIQLFGKPGDLKSEFDRAGIRVINTNYRPTYQANGIAKKVAHQVSLINPVLVHATLFRSDMVSRKLIRYVHVPLINSFVNNSYCKQRYLTEPIPIKIKLFFLQQWDALTAKRVTVFVSNSESIRQTNAHALRIPLNKIRVIYRGRTADSFDTIKEDQIQSLRQELNPDQKKVFVNVSRLIDRKGQLDLVRAFHKVIQQRKDCLLWIAGKGPFCKALEKETRMLGLQAKVRLLGNRRDVPMLLKASDYFVFPSHYEGLPGAIIEAMFARLPIIASNIPENMECVNEQMALLPPVKDIEALAQQMLHALDDVHWPERTQKAYDYALEHFEISKIAEQYEALYDEILGISSRQ